MRILYFQSEIPLASFSEACLSLTPKVFAHGKHELFLDISVTKKLFQGENNILSAAQKLVANFALLPRMALVDRPEWARAIAYGEKEILLAEGKSQSYLFSLPIDRIIYCGDPSKETEEFLERTKLAAFMKRVGLKTIFDFSVLNPTAINRRFGKMGIVLHQWITGMRELPFPTFMPQEQIYDFVDAEDIGTLEQLLLHLSEAFSRIESRLLGRRSAARELKLTFHLDGEENQVKRLKFSQPTKEANEFTKLTGDFLRTAHWEAPLSSVEVELSDIVPFNPGQLSLFDKTENSFVDLAKYVGRLRDRFGEKAVGFGDLQQSYIPERSWRSAFPPPKHPRYPARQPGFYSRPPILFSPPRPYRVARNAPLIPSENLATEWWEHSGYRRYYVSQTPQGERVWIFWDCQKEQWFIQGTFD
jgi:hypothetical protein